MYDRLNSVQTTLLYVKDYPLAISRLENFTQDILPNINYKKTKSLKSFIVSK